MGEVSDVGVLGSFSDDELPDIDNGGTRSSFLSSG